ncbi:MAG: 6-phosphogluconolactonase [Oscillospiraceae bacterium]|nr:6-phosphogluconolactonase [Oscillospiraceae bacterium]
MKTVVLNYDDLLKKAAEQVSGLLREKPDAAIALGAGEDTAPLLGELSRRCAAGELSFERARLFAVAELADVPEEKSLRRALETGFISKTDIKPENCAFPTRGNAADYDAMIAAAGGLDLALLDLGANASIGYNEPATAYDTLTHVQKLTASTRAGLAGSFGGAENTPEYALTMGVKTIVSAREIIVIALGEGKAEAAFNMLYARDDSIVPAAFLQLPPEVTVYLDGAAATKL